MKRGKFEAKPAKKSTGKKLVSLLLVLVLLLGTAIGTTLAWLIDTTAPIKNTFTYGNISLTLTEENKGVDGTYTVIPGKDYPKDPKVTVEANSEDCWLFVKVEQAGDLTPLTWSVDNEVWTAVPDVNGVYYKVVTKSNSDQPFYILKDNKVSVAENITAAQLEVLGNNSSLTFTAYAIQSSELSDGTDIVTTKDAGQPEMAKRAWLLASANP